MVMVKQWTTSFTTSAVGQWGIFPLKDNNVYHSIEPNSYKGVFLVLSYIEVDGKQQNTFNINDRIKYSSEKFLKLSHGILILSTDNLDVINYMGAHVLSSFIQDKARLVGPADLLPLKQFQHLRAYLSTF